jgi:hypothetical protein
MGRGNGETAVFGSGDVIVLDDLLGTQTHPCFLLHVFVFRPQISPFFPLAILDCEVWVLNGDVDVDVDVMGWDQGTAGWMVGG